VTERKGRAMSGYERMCDEVDEWNDLWQENSFERGVIYSPRLNC
jgi:hypothetical protein